MILDYLGGSSVITQVLLSRIGGQKRESENERERERVRIMHYEDLTGHAGLKMEEGLGLGFVGSRCTLKRQDNKSSPDLPERSSGSPSVRHLDFSP